MALSLGIKVPRFHSQASTMTLAKAPKYSPSTYLNGEAKMNTYFH